MQQGERGNNPVGTAEDKPVETSRRSRRIRVTIALSAAFALTAASGGVAYARWDSGQTQLVTAARTAFDEAVTEAAEARSAAEDVLAASEGRVADDDTTRSDLSDLLDSTDSRGLEQLTGNRAQQADRLNSQTAETQTWIEHVREAVDSVTAAQAEWELAQAVADYETAMTGLTTARDAGVGVLSGSEGQVADNAVRQQLADAIDAGNVLIDAQRPATVSELTAAATRITDATGALTTATGSTTEAQASWQAEQERLAKQRAAEAAAAAERAQNSRPPGVTRTPGGGGKPSAGGGGTPSTPQVQSPSRPSFGTGNAPACTTPSCGITF